jgi:hypothetical protein
MRSMLETTEGCIVTSMWRPRTRVVSLVQVSNGK